MSEVTLALLFIACSGAAGLAGFALGVRIGLDTYGRRR